MSGKHADTLPTAPALRNAVKAADSQSELLLRTQNHLSNNLGFDT